jgi:deazaflavin-dependent oxidoreductase (nitroreductase family)
LYYGRDGDRYVLVATAVRGGGDPAWYRNVLAHPAVVLQVRTDSFAALARPAEASERRRLWELMVDVFPKYAAYESEAGRPLPVVVVGVTSGPSRRRTSASGRPSLIPG